MFRSDGPRLFAEFPRSDPTPRRHAESSFEFLNRVESPYWARVRDQLNAWLARYPLAHVNDVRARLQSKREDQHWAAWWELYIFRLFELAGFDVEVHPRVGGSTKRPDFAIQRAGSTVYVEAITSFSGIVDDTRHGAREGWILDAVNEAQSANFFVGVDFEHVGMERPKVGEITDPLENWLAGLDPNIVAASLLAGGEPPKFRLSVRDFRCSAGKTRGAGPS
jgi:hypothetical protein